MDIRMKWYYRLGFLLLLFVVTYVFLKIELIWLPILKVVFTVLFPFIVAALITYLLHPLVEKIHSMGIHRGIAVVIIYTLFFGGVGVAFYKGIPVFIKQIKDLAENLPVFADQYRNWLQSIQAQTSEWPMGLHERIEDGIVSFEKRLETLLSTVLKSMMNIINSIFVIAIIPFISFYMLKDIDQLKKATWYLTPRKWRRQGILFLKDVNESLGSYIRGQLIVCVIIGAVSALFFWIIQMKYPLLLGFIIGVTNVIPYFGPVIGAIPAVIIAATISVKMVIFVVIIILVLQFLEGNILSPLIVGKSLHMHPLMIMFALLAGGEVSGIVGLILAVPILAIIKVAILHARNHFMKKNEAV
ncbi:AI-2E family transporter [Bacillus sp. CGMCC 1.16607]|uniref:AI-2E family transporter n=1 Tax=Bacillus sp. CGMCC 1.16607 TaxID=3351842 RepID=UPI003643788A